MDSTWFGFAVHAFSTIPVIHLHDRLTCIALTLQSQTGVRLYPDAVLDSFNFESRIYFF